MISLTAKVQQIKQSPLKLRRTINAFPYYDTLRKALENMSYDDLSEEEKQAVKDLVKQVCVLPPNNAKSFI